MSFPSFSVRNPVVVNLAMVLVVAAGLFTWSSMVREFFPAMDGDAIRVVVPYPGATPAEVEKGVARQVERAVGTVDRVEEVSTRIVEGLCVCTATLEVGTEMARALDDVRTAVDRVKPDLPEGAEDPAISEVQFTIPVIGVALAGDVPEPVLRQVARRVRDDLLDLPGISIATLFGTRPREWRVEVRPDALEAYGLTFGEVTQAVAAGNLDLPGGQLKGDAGNIPVRTLGARDLARDLEALAVRARADGRTVRLGDLADLREGYAETVQRGRFKGKPAALVTVFKTSDEDAIEISAAVKAYVRDHPTAAGGALTIEITTDLARLIQGRLDLMLGNAAQGMILVFCCLALFLELRVAFWVAWGVPMSLLGGLVVMAWWGVTINLLSLFGMIVVLGMLVDDAIVIGESIYTRMQRGEPLAQAAIRGAEEVTWPVVASVATTVIAFLPLLFIEGRMGKFLGVLPVIVIAALIVSLLEAFLMLPGHLAHPTRIWRGDWLPAPVRATVARLSARRDRDLNRRLPDAYERLLRGALRWRYPVLGGTVAALCLSVGLVAGGVIEFVLFQEVDAETLSIDLEMAPGTPEARTAEVAAQIEREAMTCPEATSVFTVHGAGMSDMGALAVTDPATVAQLVVELEESEPRERRGGRKSRDVVAQLRGRTAAIPGVQRLRIEGRSGGAQGPDLQIRVRGDDLDTVAAAVRHVRDAIAHIEGTEEIRDDLQPGKREVRLAVGPGTEALGLTTRALAVETRNALFGAEAQRLQTEDDEVTVRIVLPEAARRDLRDLGRLRIATPSGGRVPLEEVGRIDSGRGYASLRRVDGKRAVTVEADVDEVRANVANVTAQLARGLADIGARFPGVSVAFEGRQKETRESLGSLAISTPLALFAIYALIAMVFRSYVQPLIVMTAIPFGLVGAVAGHLVMGYPFTLLSLIGIVALSGIVVNDSIVMVDFMNREGRQRPSLLEAVVAGGRARLRPIILTSVTTIAGLAPLMLQRSFQAQFLIPMAISICFGLVFSTVLTLIVVPVLYLALDDTRRFAGWIWSGRWPAAADAAVFASAQMEAPGETAPDADAGTGG